MSMVCLARRPWGVLVSMGTPCAARRARPVVAIGAQPQARATTKRRRLSARRSAGVGPGSGYALAPDPATSSTTSNSSSDAPVATGLVCWPACASIGRPGRPRLERLFGFPLGHHEVAVLALDGPQQLEAEEAGLVVDCVRAMREPLLQFRTGVGGHLDCVDLHHGHAVQATAPPCRQDGGMHPICSTCQRRPRRAVVLVHGLMGRGSTWSRQLPWLTELGAVYTYDAPWHRGRDVADPHPISTERFVADLGDAVAALGRPGHAGRALDGRPALLVSGRRRGPIW